MSGCERNTFYWSFFLKCVFLRVNIVSNTSNIVKKAYIKVALFCLTEKQNFKGVSHVWNFVNWKYYCATIKLCPFVSTQVTFVSFCHDLAFQLFFHYTICYLQHSLFRCSFRKMDVLVWYHFQIVLSHGNDESRWWQKLWMFMCCRIQWNM